MKYFITGDRMTDPRSPAVCLNFSLLLFTTFALVTKSEHCQPGKLSGQS